MRSGHYPRVHRHQELLHVGDDAEVDGDVLVDRRGVAVHVDDLRAAGELRRAPAGDAVVEADAERDKKIGLGNRGVRGKLAVEPNEPERKGIGLVKRANAHQGRGDGNPRLMRERGDVFRRA